MEKDNCFIIQQIVNETSFTATKSVVMQQIVRFQTKPDDQRISQDICHVWVADIPCALTIYSQLLPCGHPTITDTCYYGQNSDPHLKRFD